MGRRRRGAAPLESVRVVIDDLDDRGRGVGRVDGKVFFVDRALPGEEVVARLRRRRAKFDEGEVEAVVRASPDRVEPRCPHFDRCGGCALQHLAPAAQIRAKQTAVLDNLRTIARLAPERVLDPVASEPWGYRRKARLGVRDVPGKGGVLVGFRERHGQKVAELESCDVLVEGVGTRIRALRALIDGLDARRRLPQIEFAGGEDALALVIRHLDPLSAHDRDRLAAFAREHDVQVYLQPGGPDTVAPHEPSAPAMLRYRLPAHDVELTYLATDFVQVNAEVNRALVDRALDLLAPASGETVLDLFCGIGNFTLPIARRGARVTGVEGSAALVDRARENAERNRLEVEYAAADLAVAEAVAPWLARDWDAILLDPPRSGAAEVVAAIGASGSGRPPARIVYVSCNPGTLARDAGVLVHERGYRLEAAGAVDMFPHTSHVESIALFTRG